jgi:hypothetical protein
MNSDKPGVTADRAAHEGSRRLMIYAAVLLAVFLIGFVPMWMQARTRASERDAAQDALRLSRLQNALADAAIDAGRGEYESARQAASVFFTDLGGELGRMGESPLTEAQQAALRPLLASRDDTITLLARSDPAVVPRLVDFYTAFREQTVGAAAP